MTVAAGPYDLTTLAAAKLWLGTTGSATDDLLQSLISSSSRFILNWLGRGNILSATYTDRFDGSGWGQRSLLLPRWPVTSISSLSNGTLAIPAGVAPVPGGANPSGWLLDQWDGVPPGKPQNLVLYGYGFGAGLQNIGLTYTAGYLVAGEAAAVPGVSAYAITVAAPYGAWAADSGVVLALTGAALQKVASNPAAGQYSVAAGVYTFNAAQAGAAVLISYSFVPADLAQACIQMVGESATYRTRIGVSSKTLGGQESITFSMRSMTPDIREMLMTYRNVVPFV